MREAVEPAVEVAFRLGIRIEKPVVLRDLTNVLVHLAPSPIVARVPVTFARARGRAWVEKELELATTLRDAGLPVAGPMREIPCGPHECNGFLVTLWEYVENDRDAALDARADPCPRAGTWPRGRTSSWHATGTTMRSSWRG